MNELIGHCLYQAGLTASGCWDELGTYEQEAIERFAKLIVKECVGIVENLSPGYQDYRNQIEDAFRSDCMAEIKYRFGVEE